MHWYDRCGTLVRFALARAAGRKPQNDLIFDLGANRGEDTAFYLAKGFRVVAVEANPILFEQAAQRFQQATSSGQLVLLNLGIWSESGSVTFYVNESNDHWSSFDPVYGTRNGTRYRTVAIPCITALELLHRYGVPHYLKIDIEGADQLVLKQLRSFWPRPNYLSVEEYGVASFRDLAALGYSRFQIVPQDDKSRAVPPNPPREGDYVARHFTPTDSGLFGRELPGPWNDLNVATTLFTRDIRRADGTFVGPAGEWYDIHATAGHRQRRTA